MGFPDTRDFPFPFQKIATFWGGTPIGCACQTIWDMEALAMFDQNPCFAMHLENVDLLHPDHPVKSNDPHRWIGWRWMGVWG